MTQAAANSRSVSAGARPPIAILGVLFDNVTKVEALELIERMVASRQSHYLVTPNVDFLVQAREDIELRRILFEAHLVLCDGTPLVWASKLLGNPLPERVAGADIVPLLIGVAEQKGYRLFLLGATPESCDQAVRRLQAKHPKLVIAGHYSPPFHTLLDMDHEEIKRRVMEAKPDVLLVSLGCPKQEKWIAMHYRSLAVPVIMGVGATIDFLAGQVRRAPVWMQRSGTEWLFRLAQEPRRLFRRYVSDLWTFGGSICRQWWRLKVRSRRRSRRVGLSILSADSGALLGPTGPSDFDFLLQCVRLPERFDLAAVCDYGLQVEQNLAREHHCLLDMSSVIFIDSTGVGFLIRLQKKVRAAGQQLVLVSPGPAVRRALEVMRLEHFFLSARDHQAARQLIEAWTREQSTAVTLPHAATGNTLAWHGEITAGNAEAIWQQTRHRLGPPSQASTCTIDLAGVCFIDSTGLGLLVRIKKFAQQRQQTVVFTNLQPAVCNVLRIARLEQFLIEPDRQEGRLNHEGTVESSAEETITAG